MASRKERVTSLVVADLPVYHIPVHQVESALGTSLKAGLSDDQVVLFREEYGSNELQQAKKKNLFLLFLTHLFNSITFILYAVFIITIVNKEYIDAGVVMFIIVGNCLLGFVQELKSEQSLAALQKMSTGVAVVRRNGGTLEIPVNEVVVGDIVLLKQGDMVPADCRVAETNNLEIDESLLTGESVTVHKGTDPLPLPEKVAGLDVRVAIGDRANMVFRQTTVVGGTGVAVVVACGYDTKVGQLSKRLQGGGDEKTPLQRRLETFMYILFGVAIFLAFIIFVITKFEFDKETTVYASATGIALLPEALIAVVTVTLALAVTRLSQKRSIVRKLQAVEVLGTVTNICSDKTGTLTEGKMVVKRVWPAGSKYIYHVTGGPMDATAGFGLECDPTNPEAAAEVERKSRATRAMSRAVTARAKTLSNADTRSHRAPSFQHQVVRVVQGADEAEYAQVQRACNELALIAAMCNNTQLQYDDENDKLVGTGNPTELALQVFSFKIGMDPYYFEEEEGWRKCGQWAFDSSVKCMSIGLVRDKPPQEQDEEQGLEDGSNAKESLILTKGAPEAILPKCKDVDMAEVMGKVTHLASQGYRVLACGVGTHLDLDDVDGKRLHDFDRPVVEKDLRFLGLFCVYDPPRESSFTAVAQCKTAGISFHMVTGDHHATAENISRRLRILEDHHGKDRIITGPVFDAMSTEQIDAMPELPLVIARCSPESKVKMVEALHRRGKIVAMTGDGINDAPAIKIADVGAAMGITGVDVTKGAADIVLTDDNIATLVSAVEEGRHVAASIQKFVVHLLASNIAEVVLLLIGLVFRDDKDEVVFPLTALEILWVNMITSTPPAIGLSVDPMDPDAMQRPPSSGNFFTREVILDQACYGLFMAALIFSAYVFVIFGVGNGEFGHGCNTSATGNTTCSLVWEARTTVFATLNELLLLQGYICRDSRKSLFAMPLFNNMVLLGSFVLGTLLLIPCIYIPWVAETLFKHRPISWEWLVVLTCMLVYLAYSEAYKYFKRTYWPLPHQQTQTIMTEDGGRIELVPM